MLRRGRSGGSGGALLVSDSFNRANSAAEIGAPEVGAAPTAVEGTWGIDTNRAYCAEGGGGIPIVTWDAPANCTVAVKFSVVPGGGSSGDIRLVLYYQDASNYVYFVGSTSEEYALYKVEDGTPTLLDTGAHLGANSAAIRAVCNGTAVAVSVGGVEEVSATVPWSSGDAGLSEDFGLDGPARWDDFSITAL